jgi:hypothetical protein
LPLANRGTPRGKSQSQRSNWSNCHIWSPKSLFWRS